MKRFFKYAALLILLLVVAFGGFFITLAWRLQTKVATVDAGVEQWMEEGRDPAPVAAIVGGVPKLMEEGKVFEALKKLDEAIVKVAQKPEVAEIEGNDDYTDPQEVTVEGYTGHIMEPFISPDGKFLFFNNENTPGAETDLHVAAYVSDVKFKYIGPLAGANDKGLDAVASMDKNGNFYFTTTRDYENTLDSLYAGRFDGKSDIDHVQKIRGLTPDEAGQINMDAGISPDGETLYISRASFTTGVPVPKTSDLIAARKGVDGFELLPDAGMFANINTDELEYAPAISEDGLQLFFTRASGVYNLRVMVAKRSSVDQKFDKPEVIKAIRGFVEAPTLAPGGSLYYHKRKDGMFRLFRVKRK